MSKKVSNKKKHDFIKIMFTIGIVGILIIVISAALVYYVTTKGKPKTKAKKPNNAVTQQEDDKVVEQDKEVKRIMGVIKTVDNQNSKITVVDIETDGIVNLKIDNTLAIKDKYGKQITFSQLMAGDIINTKYTVPDNLAQTLRISGESWEKKEVTSVVIEEGNKSIRLNNDTYSYTDNLIKVNKTGTLNLGEVTSVDVLTLKGYKDKLYYVELVKGHGKLQLTEYDAFVNGTLDIDRDKTYVIEEGMKSISITEGTHKIVAQIEEYEPFIQEINIERGKTYELSLGSVQHKKGSVEFRTNIENDEETQLFINKELVADFKEPIVLEYGTYEIQAKHKNYEEYNAKLTVDKDYTLYNIELKKKPKYINIDTNPSEVEVYIDDSFIGYSPVAAPIEPGQHEVLLKKEGYISKKHVIKIMDDDEDAYYNFPTLEYNRKSDNTNTNSNSNDESNNSNTKSVIDDLSFDNPNDNNSNNSNDNNNNSGNNTNQNDDLKNDDVLTPSDDVYDE